jgi:nucleotide-binding universal stress UspA family protein
VVDRWDRRVVVGVDGSVGSLAALRRAVYEARLRDAPLLSLLAWAPPGGNGVGGRRAPCPPELLEIWRKDARRQLRTAWEQALGGIPADLTTKTLTLRGPAGAALVELADQANALLVVGAGRPGPWRVLGAGSVTRYCVAHARCGVLTVPRPATLSRAAQRRLVRQFTAPAAG